MSRAARFIWCGVTVAAALFAALAAMSKGWLEPAGLANFDSHLAGYGPEAARAYLAALEPAQTALYLGAFRMLDTVFPMLLALCLAGGVWLNARAHHPMLRLLLLLGPATYLVMDLMENALVAQMLRTGPMVVEATILRASAFTQAKWIALAASALLILWAWRFAPKRHTRRPE